MQSHLPPHVAEGHADPTGIFGKGYSCSEPPSLQVYLCVATDSQPMPPVSGLGWQPPEQMLFGHC